jgi:hypothetical protein
MLASQPVDRLRIHTHVAIAESAGNQGLRTGFPTIHTPYYYVY